MSNTLTKLDLESLKACLDALILATSKAEKKEFVKSNCNNLKAKINAYPFLSESQLKITVAALKITIQDLEKKPFKTLLKKTIIELNQILKILNEYTEKE